jgi:hypothetical protein
MTGEALALLDAIERRETELLVWGFIDHAFTLEELHDLAARTDRVGPDAAGSAIDELLDTALCLRHLGDGGDRFRSRFAEAVRLLALSRQVFAAPLPGEPPRGWSPTSA